MELWWPTELLYCQCMP